MNHCLSLDRFQNVAISGLGGNAPGLGEWDSDQLAIQVRRGFPFVPALVFTKVFKEPSPLFFCVNRN